MTLESQENRSRLEPLSEELNRVKGSIAEKDRIIVEMNSKIQYLNSSVGSVSMLEQKLEGK